MRKKETGSQDMGQGRPAKKLQVLALALSIKLFISSGRQRLPCWLSLKELQFEDVSGLLQSVEQLACVANRPRFRYYSQVFTVAYRCLPLPASTYGFPGKDIVTCV